MKSNMQDNVIQLLKSHHKRKQRINLLRYELQQYINASGKDVIDSMTLDIDNDVTRGSGYNHDKIFYIMLNHQKFANKFNIEIISKISTELVKLQKEQNRLCYYVSLLDRQEAQLIRLVYFDGCPWNEAANELGVVHRTAHKIKKRALANLVWMYEYMESINGNNAPTVL